MTPRPKGHMMRRSLRRHIERVVNQTWNPDARDGRGEVAVVLTFPEDAFADAPQWSPGPGFESTIENYAWRRDNGDSTCTAVVAGVGPKELPGRDGGQWTDEEVWTATGPSSHIFFDSACVWDKPHRVTWLLREPGVGIRREPFAGHPSEAVHDYWESFRARWGFVPRRLDHYTVSYPYADRRRWVALAAKPATSYPNERELLHAAVLLAGQFGARARVYGPRDGRWQGFNTPMHVSVTSSPLGEVVRVLGLPRR